MNFLLHSIMNLLGLSLRKPTFLSITLAAAIATLAWLIVVAVLDYRGAVDSSTAGALLLAFMWACVCAALGLRFRDGREIAFYSVGAAMLLAAYQSLVPFVV